MNTTQYNDEKKQNVEKSKDLSSLQMNRRKEKEEILLASNFEPFFNWNFLFCNFNYNNYFIHCYLMPCYFRTEIVDLQLCCRDSECMRYLYMLPATKSIQQQKPLSILCIHFFSFCVFYFFFLCKRLLV